MDNPYFNNAIACVKSLHAGLIFMLFWSSADFFFQDKHFQKRYRSSNGLNEVGLDLDQN